MKNIDTYNFCNFTAFAESVDRKGVDGAVHWDGVDLHHPVVLTGHKHTVV